MNILLVTPFFTPQTGWVATYLEDLRRFLGQLGHQVLVLRPGESYLKITEVGRGVGTIEIKASSPNLNVFERQIPQGTITANDFLFI